MNGWWMGNGTMALIFRCAYFLQLVIIGTKRKRFVPAHSTMPPRDRRGRAKNGVPRPPEIDVRPSTVYRDAVESLGGLRINDASTNATNLQSSTSTSKLTGTRLGKSASLPALPSFFDAPKGKFVAITPTSVAGRISAPRDVTLPPLTLSLKAARGDKVEESKADEEFEEEEEEAVESDDEHAAALNGFNDRHASRSTHAPASCPVHVIIQDIPWR